MLLMFEKKTGWIKEKIEIMAILVLVSQQLYHNPQKFE